MRLLLPVWQDQALMFGLLFSLREMVTKFSPTPVTSFNSFTTDVQKVHYFQSATGIRVVLCTDTGAGDLSKQLQHIHQVRAQTSLVLPSTLSLCHPVFTVANFCH